MTWIQLLDFVETQEVWLLNIITCVHEMQNYCQSFSLVRGTLECLMKLPGLWGTSVLARSTEAGDVQPTTQTRGSDFMSTAWEFTSHRVSSLTPDHL